MIQTMFLKKIKRSIQGSKSTESGFTIIESLIAMIIIAVLLSAIAPVILLSVSTRVQARRVELAAGAASAYIDGVRSGRISQLPDLTTQNSLSAVDPPGLNLNCPNNSNNNYCTTTPPNQLYCVDGDGDNTCTKTSKRDFIIQVFRYTKPPATGSPNRTPDNGYQVGLRVYRADAFDGNQPLRRSPDKQPSFTGGLGNPKIPYFETTTEISTARTSFSDFCDRLDPRPAGSTANNPNSRSQCR